LDDLSAPIPRIPGRRNPLGSGLSLPSGVDIIEIED